MTYDNVMNILKEMNAETLKTMLLAFLASDNEDGAVCLEDFETDFIEFIKDEIKRIIVSKIKWDAPKSARLPRNIIIDITEETNYLLEDIHDYADVLCDYLSDEYGYCIESFETELTI